MILVIEFACKKAWQRKVRQSPWSNASDLPAMVVGALLIYTEVDFFWIFNGPSSSRALPSPASRWSGLRESDKLPYALFPTSTQLSSNTFLFVQTYLCFAIPAQVWCQHYLSFHSTVFAFISKIFDNPIRLDQNNREFLTIILERNNHPP